MKEGAAHCGGGAIAGGGSTRVSVNAKIQFEKPLHCSCVFIQEPDISSKEETTLIAQPAYG